MDHQRHVPNTLNEHTSELKQARTPLRRSCVGRHPPWCFLWQLSSTPPFKQRASLFTQNKHVHWFDTELQFATGSLFLQGENSEQVEIIRKTPETAVTTVTVCTFVHPSPRPTVETKVLPPSKTCVRRYKSHNFRCIPFHNLH